METDRPPPVLTKEVAKKGMMSGLHSGSELGLECVCPFYANQLILAARAHADVWGGGVTLSSHVGQQPRMRVRWCTRL